MIVQIVPKGMMLSFTPKAELLKETVPGEYLYYSWEGQTSQISYGLSIKRPWSRKDECKNKIYLDSSDSIII